MLTSKDIDSSDWQERSALNESGIQVNNAIHTVLRKSVVNIPEPAVDGDVILNVSLYSENATGSGAIYPIRSRKNRIGHGDNSHKGSTRDPDFDEESNETQSSKPLLSANNSSSSQTVPLNENGVSKAKHKVSIIFLLVQGLLAGFAFVTLFLSVDGN